MHGLTEQRKAVADVVLTLEEILWEEVPAKRSLRYRYPRMESFTELLRANPGKSARFPEVWYGSPKQALTLRYPDIEWVARSTGRGDNSYRVWGTFNDEE